MRLLIIFFIVNFGLMAQAYIPPTKMILQRVSDNAGSGLYLVEQEVQLNTGVEPVFLKETWIIENERTLRLTVTGLKELKDSVRLQFVYVGGQKWQMHGNQKESGDIPDEFLERFFHIRNHENLIAYLQGLKILPSLSGLKKPVQTGKNNEVKYEPEPFVRLSRSEGVINYAFGTPTPADQKDLGPGLWVEQDQFVIRKLRFPSQAEVTAENYGSFTRGLSFPKLRTIQWGQNTVQLRLLTVSGKVANASHSLKASSLDVPVMIKTPLNPAAQTLIEEFYTRFR